MLVRVPPLLGGLLGCSCCAPRALLRSLVQKEGHDSTGCLGTPLGTSQGASWGAYDERRETMFPEGVLGTRFRGGAWGKPCSRKPFWEHDFAVCLGGPLGARRVCRRSRLRCSQLSLGEPPEKGRQQRTMFPKACWEHDFAGRRGKPCSRKNASNSAG